MNTLRRMHADGRITDEQYRDARSRLMRDRLVASGELRPGQEPRRELGTAMLVRREDNELYRAPRRLLPFALLAMFLLTVTGCASERWPPPGSTVDYSRCKTTVIDSKGVVHHYDPLYNCRETYSRMHK